MVPEAIGVCSVIISLFCEASYFIIEIRGLSSGGTWISSGGSGISAGGT